MMNQQTNCISVSSSKKNSWIENPAKEIQAQIYVCGSTDLDLHQEVSQVLFKCRDVLVQTEQPRHKHLHLCAKIYKQMLEFGQQTKVWIRLRHITEQIPVSR